MDKQDKEMTPAERLEYLRERGIIVETAEERKLKKIQDIMNEKDTNIIDGEEYEDLKFVHVPHDESLPLKELSIKVPQNRLGKGDYLMEELKPYFKALSSSSSGFNKNKNSIDMKLFQNQATKTLGSSIDGSSNDDIQVSEAALQSVAEQGQVEAFCLVHPMPSNKFHSVNVYLDEVGMLKRLPMNKRAADFAFRAGFNPPPKFYGDVFLGRVANKPVIKNISFQLGTDTNPDAEWLRNATMENIEYQTEMNQLTGKTTTTTTADLQPSADGENGIPKQEEQGEGNGKRGYSWTQTEEEIEISLSLGKGSGVSSSKEIKVKGLNVKFTNRKVKVVFDKEELLDLDLYECVDPDGCTWTLELGDEEKDTFLIITCEKSNEMSWPRIMF